MSAIDRYSWVVPEKARKHLQTLSELRQQLDRTKAQSDALIESIEAKLQRELQQHIRPLADRRRDENQR